MYVIIIELCMHVMHKGIKLQNAIFSNSGWNIGMLLYVRTLIGKWTDGLGAILLVAYISILHMHIHTLHLRTHPTHTHPLLPH